MNWREWVDTTSDLKKKNVAENENLDEAVWFSLHANVFGKYSFRIQVIGYLGLTPQVQVFEF